jgi:hypothetical protein
MFNKLHETAISVTEYFFVAAFTWLLRNDEAAHIAAIASGVTGARKQRASMLEWLEGLTRKLDQAQVAQVAELLAFLRSKDWGSADVFRARRALARVDREYWRAMSNWYGKADPEVFVRRHPQMRPIREMIGRVVAEAPKIRLL